MVKTTQELLLELSNYSVPKTKIQRMVKHGDLYKIKRGLYETNRNTAPYLLSGYIYGPSYISFEYALSWYGLIPERVEVCTCATCCKNKSKKFITPFGNFLYRDIPQTVYPLGVSLEREGGYSYQIASPEKALCDMLYIKPSVSSVEDLLNMLFEDLRIEEEDFYALRQDKMQEYAAKYNKKNLKLLVNLLKQEG